MLAGMHPSTMILGSAEELRVLFPYALEESVTPIDGERVQIDAMIPEEIPQVQGWGKSYGGYVIGYDEECGSTVYLAKSGGLTRDITRSLRLNEERATEIRDFMLTLPGARDDWGVILLSSNI